VPAGEALGKGVTVLVGWGFSWSGVTVAVGRGPAGMLGVGIGVADSLGDSANAPAANESSTETRSRLNNRLTTTASERTGPADVIP
jgi:hypothetical protein